MMTTMRISLAAAGAATISVCSVLLSTGSARAQELSPTQVYLQAAPAVVFVAGRGPGLPGMGGTGSIIDSSGLILTNAHVVVEESSRQPYPQVMVYLKPDRVTGDQENDLRRRIKARVVAFDRALDLALLKTEQALPVEPLRFGDPDDVRIGDRVLAIGHPEEGGLWTLTTGVISAEFDDFQNVPGKHVFQTEASFNRGNSGGPLLDGYGHQIGINTSIARRAADGMAIVSINFSLKSNVAQVWLDRQGIRTAFAARPSAPAVDAVTVGPPSIKPSPSGLSEPARTAETAPPVSSVLERAPETVTTPSPPAATPAPPLRADKPPGPRPYDLDRLVQGLEAAEQDLENMMDDMRKKTHMHP